MRPWGNRFRSAGEKGRSKRETKSLKRFSRIRATTRCWKRQPSSWARSGWLALSLKPCTRGWRAKALELSGSSWVGDALQSSLLLMRFFHTLTILAATVCRRPWKSSAVWNRKTSQTPLGCRAWAWPTSALVTLCTALAAMCAAKKRFRTLAWLSGLMTVCFQFSSYSTTRWLIDCTLFLFGLLAVVFC